MRSFRGNPVFSLAVMVVAFGLVAAACGQASSDLTNGDGDNDGGGDGAVPGGELDGRTFWSTSVTEGGVERALVEGTKIELRFDGAEIGASAGCNSMGGSYSVDDGVLVVGSLFATEIGCEPERQLQDDFVADLLGAGPTLVVDGDRLVLTTADIEVEFLDRVVADPDRALVGTEWEVTGFIDGDAAMSIGVERAATMSFDDDSTLRGFDGCADYELAVEVSDGSIGGPIEGDAEIQFGERRAGSADTSACGQSADYADRVNAVFATGAATATIDGPNLTIMTADGIGITARAHDAS